jgi:hypothetical protein
MITAPGDPDGQCVTACNYFTGAPRDTKTWRFGTHSTDLTDDDIGLAIGTAVGQGANARYPTDGDQNSGIFMGRGVGGIYLADQWPSGKPISIRFLPTHDPNDQSHSPHRSDNADAYYVIHAQ